MRRKLHNTIQDLKGNIRVFCRVRPAGTEEPWEAAPGQPAVNAQPALPMVGGWVGGIKSEPWGWGWVGLVKETVGEQCPHAAGQGGWGGGGGSSLSCVEQHPLEDCRQRRTQRHVPAWHGPP